MDASFFPLGPEFLPNFQLKYLFSLFTSNNNKSNPSPKFAVKSEDGLGYRKSCLTGCVTWYKAQSLGLGFTICKMSTLNSMISNAPLLQNSVH